MLGIVTGMLGGGRLMVACKGAGDLICRIPGKIRKHIWVRDGDIVIGKPWRIGGDRRGGIMWRYNRLQADWLRSKGHIK